MGFGLIDAQIIFNDKRVGRVIYTDKQHIIFISDQSEDLLLVGYDSYELKVSDINVYVSDRFLAHTIYVTEVKKESNMSTIFGIPEYIINSYGEKVHTLFRKHRLIEQCAKLTQVCIAFDQFVRGSYGPDAYSEIDDKLVTEIANMQVMIALVARDECINEQRLLDKLIDKNGLSLDNSVSVSPQKSPNKNFRKIQYSDPSIDNDILMHIPVRHAGIFVGNVVWVDEDELMVSDEYSESSFEQLGIGVLEVSEILFQGPNPVVIHVTSTEEKITTLNPSPWVGVDLDGTLAYFDKWQGIEHIGEPIIEMCKRVSDWVIAEGRDVRIFTARVSGDDADAARRYIEEWCLKHLGFILPVTCVKDNFMIELWDDRCVEVVKNEGRTINHQDDTKRQNRWDMIERVPLPQLRIPNINPELLTKQSAIGAPVLCQGSLLGHIIWVTDNELVIKGINYISFQCLLFCVDDYHIIHRDDKVEQITFVMAKNDSVPT